MEKVMTFSEYAEKYREEWNWKGDQEFNLLRPSVQQARLEEAYLSYVLDVGEERGWEARSECCSCRLA